MPDSLHGHGQSVHIVRITRGRVYDGDTVRWLLGQELLRATAFALRPSSNAPEGVGDPLVILFETDAGRAPSGASAWDGYAAAGEEYLGLFEPDGITLTALKWNAMTTGSVGWRPMRPAWCRSAPATRSAAGPRMPGGASGCGNVEAPRRETTDLRWPRRA
jgi:hypothetical protein